MRITLSFIIVLLFTVSPTLSQWQRVATNAVRYNETTGGVLTHVGSTLWAGWADVTMSTNNGVTWQNRTPVGFANGDIVLGMKFLDAGTGIFGTITGSLFRTLDGGMNWQDINPFQGNLQNIFDVAFMGAPDRIACATSAGNIFTTINGGATWKETSVADIITSLAWKDGMLYAIGRASNDGKGHLFKTADLGQTWLALPGTYDWDSFGIAVDSCSPSTFYIANEEVATQIDNVSTVYRSTDDGVTWVSTDPHPLNYHCGSVQVIGKTVFTQTYSGLTRSRDKGNAWKEIGGPPNRFDSRLFTALSENLIFAVDSEGSVWRTNNSGGDSVIVDPVLLFPDTLFSLTDILACDDSVATLHFVSPECNPRRIINSIIEGSDSLSYRIFSIANDSVSILFTPSQSRIYPATLVVKLSDGTERRVPITGRQIKLYLTLEKIFHTDTIGARISVPIIIGGLDKPRDVEFVMHFDKGLVYEGTSLGAKTFDVTGTTTNTSSHIFISAADMNLDLVSAYANFLVYPDSVSSWNVRFDSLSAPSLGVLCKNEIFLTTLTGPAGCGIAGISHYVRTEHILLDRIIPNPTSGGIDVSFHLPTDDGVTFELIDSRGIIIKTLAHATMTKGAHTLHFDLANETAGNYFVKMATASGEKVLQKCIIER